MKKYKRKGCSSKYIGVSYHIRWNKWIAYINIDKKNIYLGGFYTEKEAAILYNKTSKVFYGKNAYQNIIK